MHKICFEEVIRVFRSQRLPDSPIRFQFSVTEALTVIPATGLSTVYLAFSEFDESDVELFLFSEIGKISSWAFFCFSVTEQAG